MCPHDTSVYSFYYGVVHLSGYNTPEGDYGGVIIVKYDMGGQDVFVLYGHLNKEDAERWRSGDKVNKGQLIAKIGRKEENGGWEPHLHLQVQLTEPRERDMPGVVSEGDIDRALEEFPCPMKLLGLEGEGFEC
jgi:murein DD-endopeptidase MepM/ murein hydrolase activator NlpD